jgi:vesicular inhibitory amino acid transporter
MDEHLLLGADHAPEGDSDGRGDKQGSAVSDWLGAPVSEDARHQVAAESHEEDDKKKVEAFPAFCNLYNQLEGLGILGIPFAFSIGGWWTIGAVLLVAAGSGYTGWLLSRCLYNSENQRVRTSYGEIALAAGGRSAQVGVQILTVITLLGVITLYLILITDGIADTGWGKDTRMLVTCAMTFPIIHLRSLWYASYLSGVAMCAISINFFAVMVYGVQQISTDGAAPLGDSGSHDVWRVIGLVFFTFSAHSTFPDHERSLRRPQQFPKVLGATFSVLASTKLIFGLTAWLAFGTNVKQGVFGMTVIQGGRCLKKQR